MKRQATNWILLPFPKSRLAMHSGARHRLKPQTVQSFSYCYDLLNIIWGDHPGKSTQIKIQAVAYIGAADVKLSSPKLLHSGTRLQRGNVGQIWGKGEMWLDSQE